MRLQRIICRVVPVACVLALGMALIAVGGLACAFALTARASSSSTSIRGNCLRICSTTSSASRSGRLRSINTLSHGNCSNFASACAPPNASSLYDPAYTGSFITCFRNSASALAIRIRLRERTKLDVAVAAMVQTILETRSVDQSALICVLGRKNLPSGRQKKPCASFTKVFA